MPLHIEMFPQSVIDLNEEVVHHPDLMAILHKQTDKDITIMISEIAAFCGIRLEGTYLPEQLLTICSELKDHLYRRRTGITIIH